MIWPYIYIDTWLTFTCDVEFVWILTGWHTTQVVHTAVASAFASQTAEQDHEMHFHVSMLQPPDPRSHSHDTHDTHDLSTARVVVELSVKRTDNVLQFHQVG